MTDTHTEIASLTATQSPHDEKRFRIINSESEPIAQVAFSDFKTINDSLWSGYAVIHFGMDADCEKFTVVGTFPLSAESALNLYTNAIVHQGGIS